MTLDQKSELRRLARSECRTTLGTHKNILKFPNLHKTAISLRGESEQCAELLLRPSAKRSVPLRFFVVVAVLALDWCSPIVYSGTSMQSKKKGPRPRSCNGVEQALNTF